MSRHRLQPAIAERLLASDARIVVTGAGGWLGLATLELLHSTLGPALGKRVACFGASRRELTLLDGTRIAQRALVEIADLTEAPTLLLHLAFLTKDRVAGMDEAAYRAANRLLSARVLNALDAIGARGVFVASSGAARRATDPAASHDMRLYGALKREDEEAFAAWADAGPGRNAVVTRIFNVSGPHINKPQSYALAAFILDALAGRAVTVKAVRRVTRSYVAIHELMSLVLGLMLDPSASLVRFDTCGTDVLEMREIAARVASLVGDAGVDAAPIDPTLPGDEYVGERGHYADLLAVRGIAEGGFDAQVIDTAAFLRHAGEVDRVLAAPSISV